jgi:ketosteroid isomerase-like protein
MDEDDVRRATQCFYQAITGVLGGDAAPMLAIWSHADDATYCDTRGEIQRGWAALEGYWRHAAEMNAGAKAKLTTTAREQAMYATADLAYTVMIEEVRQTDGTFVLEARATNVYRREGGAWRVAHRHADAPPRTALQSQGG